ncbi:putative nuclease HARBI1 [Bactrocera neohumeralis]|uniref:putative nuclease HARBI1 n=1 Tax=Bactrocera neohumeralis TaxID=98809 RepID=UPI0021660D14|nr:putative nuclease HARBI1 [Bactrocera neohumeralis]
MVKDLLHYLRRKKSQGPYQKNKKYLETINGMPNDVFYSHFRMQISTFEKLHCMLEPLWSKLSTGRPRGLLKKCFYMTKRKLCNQSSLREVSDRFNIGMGACYRGLIQCIQIISAQKQIIAFPTTELTQKRVMEAFESCRSHSFPYVLGCILGTHIQILQPTKDGISYYNRKGTHSVIAVADSNMRYLDVFIGYLGRCHDAAVWSASPLKREIVNGLISFPPECHLLGDAAYPLETYLMVPFKDNGFLSEAQTTYNNILSSTRVCVEQAFGVLKKSSEY